MREGVSCDEEQCGCLERTGRLAKQQLQQPALEDAFKNAGRNASVCMHRAGKGSGTQCIVMRNHRPQAK